MEFDTVSISSSDSDDVPLKVIGGLHDVPITSAILKTRSLQHCDFCEEVFLNKYEMLIHNAKHIIIPLIKRELHQCTMCLFYFTSRYKLKHHIRNKHKNDVKLNIDNVNVRNDATKANPDKNHAKPDNDKPNKNIKEKVNLKHDITKANTYRNHAKLKHDNEKTKDIKEKVILKYDTKGNNDHLNIDIGEVKHNNEKSNVVRETFTIYESDDDLPLVNGNLKATRAIIETGKGETKCGTSVLKEALLKDVKVVIEKIELRPEKNEPQLSVNKVPEKLENDVNFHDIQKVNEIESKLMKMPNEKTKAKTVSTSSKVKISSRLRFEDDDMCDDAVMKDLTMQYNVNFDNEKPKHNNEKNKDIKEKVNLKHYTKGNNDHFNIDIGEVKHNNEKSNVVKEIVTIYESDDDLPLVNGNLKATRAVIDTGKGETKCGTILLKEALLKDVKVVIEKIELSPEKIEPQLSVNKVHEKVEVNAKCHNSKEVNEIEPKLLKMPDEKTKANTVNTSPKVKISSRLRFEDDGDMCDDAVMKDLTTDCIVDMNLFNEPWFDELAKSINNDDISDDMIISLVDDDEESPEGIGEKEDGGVYSASIHHDELVKPGVYRCRKCQQMFPTRFNQIQHEMSHMHIRKPRPVLCEHCDRFIANKKSLKVHIVSEHNMHYRQRTYKTCTKCNLKYNNYERHLENYHNFLRCHLCNRGFETEIDRLNHIRGHLVKIKCEKCGFIASELEIQEHKRRFHKAFVSLADFNLCDVCCLFLRNKHNTHYVFGETVSQIGSRLDCEHCGNKFFHLTQVRRTVKGRPTDRFQFEKERERKKVLTNTERLKNIQQRLKMINKLSRF